MTCSFPRLHHSHSDGQVSCRFSFIKSSISDHSCALTLRFYLSFIHQCMLIIIIMIIIIIIIIIVIIVSIIIYLSDQTLRWFYLVINKHMVYHTIKHLLKLVVFITPLLTQCHILHVFQLYHTSVGVFPTWVDQKPELHTHVHCCRIIQWVTAAMINKYFLYIFEENIQMLCDMCIWMLLTFWPHPYVLALPLHEHSDMVSAPCSVEVHCGLIMTSITVARVNLVALNTNITTQN